MNREEILQELKIMDRYLSSDEYVVVYSAAMVLCGLKDETNDIDIMLKNKSSVIRLVARGLTTEEYRGHTKISATPHIDVFDGGMATEVKTTISHGYYIQTVESYIREKVMRAREKDINDVYNIGMKLKTQGHSPKIYLGYQIFNPNTDDGTGHYAYYTVCEGLTPYEVVGDYIKKQNERGGGSCNKPFEDKKVKLYDCGIIYYDGYPHTYFTPLPRNINGRSDPLRVL